MPHLRVTCGAFASLLVATIPALGAPVESVLYSFKGGADGAAPVASLVADSAGNFYTTTRYGGVANNGTIVMLERPKGKQAAWREKVIYSFGSGTKGKFPLANILVDATGNLYTTTNEGGAGWGTVLELSPPAAGRRRWTESVLHRFRFGIDGGWPCAGLVADSAGSLYTTIPFGGVSGVGAVIKLSRPASGGRHWRDTTLFSFEQSPTTGAGPVAGLTFDAAGNLYTTTSVMWAGAGSGAIVKLSPQSGSTAWSEEVLSSAGLASWGYDPDAAVIRDSAGNLYTTTQSGGGYGIGSIAKLSPPAAGQTSWTGVSLYGFAGRDDGFQPLAAVIADAAGNLYTSASEGGLGNAGTIIKLTPPAAGQTAWTETTLWGFHGTDGTFPAAALIADQAGNLYTTTRNGGANGAGAIIELSGTGLVTGAPAAR